MARQHILALLVLWGAGPFFSSSKGAKLPSDFKRCVVKDPPGMDECFKEAIEDALPKLKGGNPKLGLFPLDPLKIDRLELSQGGQGPLNIKFVNTNVSIKGSLTGTKVTDAKVDAKALKFKFTCYIPQALIESDYQVSGRILLLPITGKGPSTITLGNLTAIVNIEGKWITKPDGKEYMEVLVATADLRPQKFSIKMDNLFNGDKQLGEAMNRVINDNSEVVYKELSGSLNEAYGEIFMNVVGQLFSRVPLKDIFIYED